MEPRVILDSKRYIPTGGSFIFSDVQLGSYTLYGPGEVHIRMEKLNERRVATKQRRARGNGTSEHLRRHNLGRRIGDRDAHQERRKGSPSPRWSSSANAWVPVIDPRTPWRRKDDAERRSSLPRRATFNYPLVEGAVYGNQMVGKRKALFDRRKIDRSHCIVAPDFRTERRVFPDLAHYATSKDPRVRALERRKVVQGVNYFRSYIDFVNAQQERRVGPTERRIDEKRAMKSPHYRRGFITDRRKR